MSGGLEIDRDPLFFPVAVAGRVEPLLFAGRRCRRLPRVRVRHGRRRAERRRRVEMPGPFHGPDMRMGVGNAKR